MLFKRFTFVTVFAALVGIMVSNVIESTQVQKRGMAFESRLKQWEIHDARKACERDMRLCSLGLSSISII